MLNSDSRDKIRTVLQINITANSGSTGRIAEEIGKLVMDKGWKSYIAYSRTEINSRSETIKIGNKLDMFLHGLLTRIFDAHGLGSRITTKRFLREISKIKPDVIHLHIIHGYFLNYKLLFNYLAEANIPVVWTLHDCWPFTGHCTYFDFANCDKWKTECTKCPQVQEYPKSLFWDRSKKNYSGKKRFFQLPEKLVLVPVSNWLGGLLTNSFLSRFPQKVIHNGINLQNFNPTSSTFREKHNLFEKTVVLGVALLWDRRKGFDDFIRLSGMVDKDVVIVLVGLSQTQLKLLPSNIIGLSKTESIQELAQIYSCADVFFNPTWEDNYPTTNLEAIACGTPVITYRTGGSVESIGEASGMVIEKGDLEGFLKALKIVKEKGKAFYARKCRAYALQNFDKDKVNVDYLELYNRAMANEEF